MPHKQFLGAFVYIFCCILSLQLEAQTIQWQNSLGGSDDDHAMCVQQTSDGGFILAGYSVSNDGDVTGNHGNDDYWVVKLEPSGNMAWQKSLGGSETERALSIQQTNDGGFIVAGYSKSNDGDVTNNHGSSDYWVVKLFASGDIEWQKSLGGSEGDIAKSIQQTADGGFIIAGTSESMDGDVTVNNGGSDYWVVKLYASGDIEWQKSLGGADYEITSSIQQTSDGGYIVAGGSQSLNGDVIDNHGSYDYWIVKLDASGNIMWQKNLGGSSGEVARSIQQTSDDGFIVAGGSGSTDGDVTNNHGYHDYWVMKLDTSGNILWQKSLGGSESERAFSIQQTTDDGFIVAGHSRSADGDVNGNYGNYDSWVVNMDASGNIVWQKNLGGSDYDYTNSIQQTIDGGFIVASSSNSDDGDLTVNQGGSDYWVVKLGAGTTSVDESYQEISSKIIIRPNPIEDKAVLHIPDSIRRKEFYTFAIYDVTGRKILERKVRTGSTEISTSDIPAGIHFYQLRHKNLMMCSGKVIVAR